MLTGSTSGSGTPSPWATLLLVPAGLVLLVLAATVKPLAAAWGRLAYRLLGGSMTDDHRPLTEPSSSSVAVHGTVVGGIGVLLVTIWALTTQGYFWPMWPILALSLPLAVHAWTVQVLTRPQLVPPRPPRLRHPGRSRRRWSPSSSSSGLGRRQDRVRLLLADLARPRAHGGPDRPPPDRAVLAAQLDLERRIEVLTTTRAGAVDAQERELRRIERDLHDGAQARLVALGMSLGMAEQKLATDPETARSLLAEARGHPGGVGGAAGPGAASTRRSWPTAGRGRRARRSVARAGRRVGRGRAPVAGRRERRLLRRRRSARQRRQARRGHPGRRPHHAQPGRLVVEVTDDGRGGADPSGTGGLSGLRRRVEALDGTLQVVSPQDGPTTVRAEMPCE